MCVCVLMYVCVGQATNIDNKTSLKLVSVILMSQNFLLCKNSIIFSYQRIQTVLQ